MNVVIQICHNIWHLSPKPEPDAGSAFKCLSCCSDSCSNDFRHSWLTEMIPYNPDDAADIFLLQSTHILFLCHAYLFI